MKLICDSCGLVKEVVVDGYPFGDRILEGLEFIVSLDKDIFKANERCIDDPYFNQLNKKYWLKECVDYVKHCKNDLVGTCLKCSGDVILECENKS